MKVPRFGTPKGKGKAPRPGTPKGKAKAVLTPGSYQAPGLKKPSTRKVYNTGN